MIQDLLNEYSETKLTHAVIQQTDHSQIISIQQSIIDHVFETGSSSVPAASRFRIILIYLVLNLCTEDRLLSSLVDLFI
jgi:hypothetical protein